MRARISFPPLRFLRALLLCGLVAACSVVETPRTQRGNRIDPDQLKELVVGTSTKADVTSLLGSPTARATFDENRWLYISETTNIRIGRTPGVLDQNVVVMNFDDGGVLRRVQQLNQDNGVDVAMSGRSTPSPGSEASFLQQLLGNLGKYTNVAPGGLGGGGSGSGAPQTGL